MSSPIKVTLPDQSVRELPRPMSVAEIAASIGPGLAKSAVAGKINGELVDIRTVVDKDSKIEIVTLQNKDATEVIRHSTAHVLAQAVQSLWPDVKVTIGPVIDTGFFYDLDSPRPFAPEDLEKIEKEMAKVVAANYEIKKEVWPVQKAIDTFKSMGERFKVEIIQDLAAKGETEVSVYHQGPWFDLCRGPHVPTTGFIKAFKLTSIAGAYWRGDEKNPMLQRIYGTAFSSKKELDEYLIQLEEAKKRDHRKLGKELNLFTFHQWAPASPFFYPRGTVIYNELVAYCRELYRKYGYSEVITPQIFDVELFHCSGHTENYKDNMYFTNVEERDFGIKPMNCPGHCLLYGTDKHSYRELPIRMADFGRLHRYERSGVLHGLARVRSFSQDDAHIFCTDDQLEQEIDSFLAMTDEVYRTLGFAEYKIALSTRPEKRMGTDAQWDRAEKILEDGLKKHKIDYTLQPGEGAFYGPKYELQVVDAIKRPWQLATLQLDQNLPERFKLEYQGADNSAHRPIMLHRAILGSLERFVAVLTEHVAGHFPTWIAPNQVLLLNVTQSQEEYCKELHKRFLDAGIRAEMDLRNEKLGFKIREGQLQKSPYMLIIGDKELQNKNISVRHSSGKQFEGLDFEQFLGKLKGEIKERKLKSVFIESP